MAETAKTHRAALPVAVQGLLLFAALLAIGRLLSRLQWVPDHGLGYIALWALAFALSWAAVQAWKTRQRRS